MWDQTAGTDPSTIQVEAGPLEAKAAAFPGQPNLDVLWLLRTNVALVVNGTATLVL